MRYDDDHKQKTRAKVLSVAARAIRAGGPDKVGVAQIMGEAGLTHGGFYAHFASKDALVAEAVSQMFLEAEANFVLRVGRLPPAEALEAYINFYLSRSHRDTRDSGCPLPALSADMARLSGEARVRFGDGVELLTERVAGLLAATGQPAPRALAASLLAEMVGAVTLARAVADPAQSDSILKSARAAAKARAGLTAKDPIDE